VSPIDHDKAASFNPNGRGVLVTLTPQERHMIRQALQDLHAAYRFAPAEDEIYHGLLRRIPDPSEKP
jgi:hypothetical protein